MGARMRRNIGCLSVCFFFTLALATTDSKVASAQSANLDFHVTTPAVACTQANPGSLTFWNGELLNNGSSTQFISCPIVMNDTNTGLNWLSAYSAGTANGVSCSIHMEYPGRTGCISSYFNRIYEPGYEVGQFSFTGLCGSGRGGTNPVMFSLECSLAVGAIFDGYQYDQFLSNWN